MQAAVAAPRPLCRAQQGGGVGPYNHGVPWRPGIPHRRDRKIALDIRRSRSAGRHQGPRQISGLGGIAQCALRPRDRGIRQGGAKSCQRQPLFCPRQGHARRPLCQCAVRLVARATGPARRGSTRERTNPRRDLGFLGLGQLYLGRSRSRRRGDVAPARPRAGSAIGRQSGERAFGGSAICANLSVGRCGSRVPTRKRRDAIGSGRERDLAMAAGRANAARLGLVQDELRCLLALADCDALALDVRARYRERADGCGPRSDRPSPILFRRF